MLVAPYQSKKALKAAVGQGLRHIETSIFGAEYKPTGTLTVVGPGAYDRKWFAKVTLKDGIITGVK